MIEASLRLLHNNNLEELKFLSAEAAVASIPQRELTPNDVEGYYATSYRKWKFLTNHDSIWNRIETIYSFPTMCMIHAI